MYDNLFCQQLIGFDKDYFGVIAKISGFLPSNSEINLLSIVFFIYFSVSLSPLRIESIVKFLFILVKMSSMDKPVYFRKMKKNNRIL